MPNNSIREKCHINTNYDSDTFVGIKCENGDFTISFPLGFSVSEDERLLRKEIVMMLVCISSATSQMESKLLSGRRTYPEEGFPFQAYLYVLTDFYDRGYYKEREQQFQVSRKGKIDWNRTIKTQKPYVQGNNAFYLDFVTRKSAVNENEMITLIHEFLVYDSMRKIGWLFTSADPAKPRIKYNPKLFKTVIIDKLNHTFNDRNKTLFKNMLAIIDHLQDENAPVNYKCGTNRFEYVWESLIDRVYGIRGKEEYFPKTTWHIGSVAYNNASLEPDSIMICRGNIYVLDAKYYKYGATRKPWDLPESTSINKQITYGEYIAEEKKFKLKHGNDYKTYNAFIMPFNRLSWDTKENLISIGEATSDWKSDTKEYERIVGILIDVKHLMQISVAEEEEEILLLAQKIEETISGGYYDKAH